MQHRRWLHGLAIASAVHGLADPAGADGAGRGDWVVVPHPCAKPAEVRLAFDVDGLDNGNGGSITLVIAGVEGAQPFTFASGTALTDITAALDSFAQELGIEVANDLSTGEVVMRSTGIGPAAFISVVQIPPTEPFEPRVCVPDSGEPCGYSGVDFGEHAIPGDVNCDDLVNLPDLLSVLESWGSCPDDDPCPADLTQDQHVNVFDLLAVLNHWTG